MEQPIQKKTQLSAMFVQTCKRRLRQAKVADSTGAQLTGGDLLARTLVLRRLLRRHVLAADERHVGLLLPPTVAAVVANMALAVDHRVAANLNYTVSSDVNNQCIAQAGIRHVLTSRRFLQRLQERGEVKLDAELVYLEDFKDKVTLKDKIAGGLGAYALPAGLLCRCLGLNTVKADDLLTILFTSGSTGQPKGVMLSYGNVAHNVEAIEQVVQLTPRDVLVGILPFFHSFGYTATLWTVLTIDVQGVYHVNPLEAKEVGKLCRRHGGTLLLATPTFLRSYVRRCEKEDFATLEVVVTGAEKLPKDLADAFENKFGVRPVEGYGTTELSPLVSVNVPASRSKANQKDYKEGSVGCPVSGVQAQVVDLDTGQPLGPGQPGMLRIRGPNVMQGYLNRPEQTAEVIQDGWYVTGDVALIDEEGFIHITDRLNRFSKIGGEMVPHIKIEEALAQLLGTGEEGQLKAVVTSLPHPTKGERLVVVHTPIDKTPEQLRQGLRQAGLPNLFVPAEDSFVQVDEIPVLGSGKLDLRALKQLAAEKLAPAGQAVKGEGS